MNGKKIRFYGEDKSKNAIRNFWCLTCVTDQSSIINLISSFSLPFSTRYNPLIVECLLVFKVQSASKLLPRSYLTSHANKVAFISEINLFVFWRMSHDLSQNALMWSQASGSDPPECELQSWLTVLPMSGDCTGTTLLGLRMNWHCVSGGRHWSSSSTPGQSVGVDGSLPAPPPLLPPSRMWLILMLKGNSWPEWEVEVQRLEVICMCNRCMCHDGKAKTWYKLGHIMFIYQQFWVGMFGILCKLQKNDHSEGLSQKYHCDKRLSALKRSQMLSFCCTVDAHI